MRPWPVAPATDTRKERTVIPETDIQAVASAEVEETDEERTVWLWRFQQLLLTGYPELYASVLASRRAVDLELARRLVGKLGCPPELAVRILL
jgi:hypothetical protein